MSLVYFWFSTQLIEFLIKKIKDSLKNLKYYVSLNLESIYLVRKKKCIVMCIADMKTMLNYEV